MIRLRMLKEFLRNTEEKKGGVQKLQALIAEGKRNEKEDDSEVQAGNKSIKIVFNVT